MTESLFLDDEDLVQYGLKGDDTADCAKALLKHQRETWPLMKTGTGHLATVQTRSLAFKGFEMQLQFNPGRIVSSSAKVDSKSISERKCFLCMEHLPPEQKGFAIGDYIILGNPFPIFPEHFTIPHREHIPQLIADNIGSMLQISKCMGKHYTLFYNGPKCGASAPDHLHFQAGSFGFMPIDANRDSNIRHFRQELLQNSDIQVTAVDDGLRRYIEMSSNNSDKMVNAFGRIYKAFQLVTGNPDDEPMLNILCLYRNNKWNMIIFLRRKHRPEQYFLAGDDRILFSPASVDFGGVCITPVEKDFHRITPEILRNIFEQVSVTAEDFQGITLKLRSEFRNFE